MITMIQVVCSMCNISHTKTLKQVNQAIKRKGQWNCLKCMAGHNKLQLEGKIFGRLTVVSAEKSKSYGGELKSVWNCVCECGNKHTVTGNLLQTGQTKSCGCLALESIRKRSTTHGKSNTREFKIWMAMKARCNNKNTINYENYGGRGIRVCKRWDSFELFIEDMGVCPKGFSIERKDTNGNYEPSNCIWADRITQARNTRRNRIIEFNGESKTLIEWANQLQIDQGSLRERLYKWTLAESLTTPKGKKR